MQKALFVLLANTATAPEMVRIEKDLNKAVLPPSPPFQGGEGDSIVNQNGNLPVREALKSEKKCTKPFRAKYSYFKKMEVF